MIYFDEQLHRLQEQTARLKRLESIVRELRCQRAALKDRISALEKQKADEQADIERLERRSLAAFLYNVIGRIDEHLDKERAEAYAAAVKYDAAVKELAAVEAQLEQSEGELARLAGCETRYQTALNQKAAAITAAGGQALLQLQTRSAALRNHTSSDAAVSR